MLHRAMQNFCPNVIQSLHASRCKFCWNSLGNIWCEMICAYKSSTWQWILNFLQHRIILFWLTYIRGALTDFVCSVQVFAWIFRNRFMISSSCILLNIWGKCSSRKKYVYQRDFTLPCVSPEIDHRLRQKRGTWAVGRFCRWWQHDNMELTCFM